MWSTPSLMPPLDEKEIHLWKIDLNSQQIRMDLLESVLSEEELSRAKRFRTDQLYQRFVVTRSMLRYMLGHYTDTLPSQLMFHYSSAGKPFLNENIHFNVSHSRDLAMLAFSKRYAVGVDLEHIQKMENLEGICLRFLAAKEYELIYSSPESKRLPLFYDIWVRKEAYTKALGGSLFDVLATFKSQNKTVENQSALTVQSFYTHQDYASAFVLLGKVETISYLQAPFSLILDC